MAAPVVLAMVVSLLIISGGIFAAVALLFYKRKKATINPDSLQFTLPSSTNNGPASIEEKKVKVLSVCT